MNAHEIINDLSRLNNSRCLTDEEGILYGICRHTINCFNPEDGVLVCKVSLILLDIHELVELMRKYGIKTFYKRNIDNYGEFRECLMLQYAGLIPKGYAQIKYNDTYKKNFCRLKPMPIPVAVFEL